MFKAQACIKIYTKVHLEILHIYFGWNTISSGSWFPTRIVKKKSNSKTPVLLLVLHKVADRGLKCASEMNAFTWKKPYGYQFVPNLVKYGHSISLLESSLLLACALESITILPPLWVFFGLRSEAHGDRVREGVTNTPSRCKLQKRCSAPSICVQKWNLSFL